MNDGIRIRLSVGAVALAAVHAILLAVVLTALHTQSPAKCGECDAWELPSARPTAAPPVGTVEKLDEPQRVNLQAQGELKQQGAPCPPNQPSRIVVGPTNVRPTIAQPATPIVVPRPAQVPPGVVDPPQQSTRPVANPASPPPKKDYQLALFVSGDSQSQKLQRWFAEHPQLVKLRSKCEFQVYTPKNSIYRTRFAELVPAEQFPVVLFQDSSGGHVHAAGRSMIPSSADELYSDLRQGYELYRQAKQAQKTGAVKARGYSWDDAISPALYLSSEDCPDGYCPDEPTDTWRPGDRVRDVLFDEARDTRDAFLWASAKEIATVALFVLAVILLGFILIKRGL